MRKERQKNGAIGFETDEVRFKLAPDGTPLEAYVKDRKEAHLLIEDFMLLANKEVALFMDNKGKDQQEVPFVYRIHDLPDMSKVADFARFAAELGHPLKVDTPRQIAQSFNDLMLAAHAHAAPAAHPRAVDHDWIQANHNRHAVLLAAFRHRLHVRHRANRDDLIDLLHR